MTKKLLSLFAGLSVVVSSLAVPSAAAGRKGDIRIAVASDLHYCVPDEKLEGNIDDPVYWYANRRGAMVNESGLIIDEFLRQCAGNECDYVLISGDVADNGRNITRQHFDIARKFAAFEQTTGKQVYVIDGNHDLGYGSETDVGDFKRIYASFGYDEALAVDDDSCSYTADLGEKYRLIALDSCDHSVSTADGLTAARTAWLREQAEQAQKDRKNVIVMMHHNLLDHMPAQRVFSRNFIVRNHLLNAELFAGLGIKTVFTGHEHCSDVSAYTGSLGNKIYDFATTSLTMYPLQYRMVSFSDEKIAYGVRTIDSIDTAALSRGVDGYTPAQLALMDAGLNDYALGFLKAGIRYRLALSLSMEKIGISEGEAFYDLVNTAAGGVTDILAMPLYASKALPRWQRNTTSKSPKVPMKTAGTW